MHACCLSPLCLMSCPLAPFMHHGCRHPQYAFFNSHLRTEASARAAGLLVSKQPKLAGKEGLNGYCPLLDVPYISYLRTFLVPTWHCLLFGIVRNFVKHVLDVLKEKEPASLKHIIAAPKHFGTTTEAGRNYKCVWLYR